MKLILKEYLASLRERDELDALLPDLLSQMGLNVFSAPSVGGRQYGVDVAAFGSLDGGSDTVYLFSVKAKDLTRRVWNSGSEQDLLPSLNDIINTYIPNHLPTEYKDKPIEICLCYGGELKENVRLDVSTYEEKNTSEYIRFTHWGGDRLASLIESFFLREDLLPKNFRPLMRKSLALLDEPDISFKFFKLLLPMILVEQDDPEKDLKSMRQLNIFLWVLFAWCRDQNNLESAYLASEFAVLRSWDLVKKYRNKDKKVDRQILGVAALIHQLHQNTANEYVNGKISKSASSLHSLSNAVNSSNSLDVNLKMFDLIGRMALSGLWNCWLINRLEEESLNSSEMQKMKNGLLDYRKTVIQVLANNPILYSPCKDEQAIDIALVSWFLSITGDDIGDLRNWLLNIVEYTAYNFGRNGVYPCILREYHELINHPISDNEKYRQKVTAGSILYPLISLISAIHGFDDVYKKVQAIKSEYLEHSNFQIWYPNNSTEEHLYSNSKPHGLTLSDVDIGMPKDKYLRDIFKECDNFNIWSNLSASYCWPIILTACRHHRIPMPIVFFRDLFSQKYGTPAAEPTDSEN